MKKILLLLAAIVGLVACDKQEVDVWKSEAYDYSGRFLFQVSEEETPDKVIIPLEGHEIRIFNSSENKSDEIWIDDHDKKIPFKALYKITGSYSNFKSAKSGFDAQIDNSYQLGLPSAKEKVGAPTKVGEKVAVKRFGIRSEILEGKISPKSFKTKGNNQADELFLKIKFYSGEVLFESVEKPKALWTLANVPEYAWQFRAVKDVGESKVLIFSGHRFTGYPEDAY